MARDSAPPSNRSALASTASEQRDTLIRKIIEKERAETDAKTARLKAQRLAHEVELAAQPKPDTKPKR